MPDGPVLHGLLREVGLLREAEPWPFRALSLGPAGRVPGTSTASLAPSPPWTPPPTPHFDDALSATPVAAPPTAALSSRRPVSLPTIHCNGGVGTDVGYTGCPPRSDSHLDLGLGLGPGLEPAPDLEGRVQGGLQGGEKDF